MKPALFATPALVCLMVFTGCVVDESDDPDRPVQVSGRVTYRGKPVERGMIHFLAVNPATNPTASGSITAGEIRAVSTRRPGDGIKPGRYKIAITAFDDDLVQSARKRDGTGPDPIEVSRAANQIKKLIPVRYNNARESGLVAELTAAHHALDLELVD